MSANVFGLRGYPEFMSDARIIASMPEGAKLSWTPSNIPTYESHFQGIARYVKSWMSYTANGIEASRLALQWAESFTAQDNLTILREDKETLSNTIAVFGRLAKTYTSTNKEFFKLWEIMQPTVQEEEWNSCVMLNEPAANYFKAGLLINVIVTREPL